MMDLDFNFKENTRQLGMTIKRRADDELWFQQDTRPKTTGEYLEEGEQMMEQKTGPSATLGFFHSEQEYNGPALHTLRLLQIGIFTTTGDHPDTA